MSTNPIPTQPETLEGCPFCPAELTPLPSAHLPADLHEQASEWYQITHNVGCYLLLLGFGDYPIHRDRLKAWNTRRSTGAVEVWRVVEIINRFSVCRDHDQPSHCVQCDLRHKAIAAVRAAATSSPTPAESDLGYEQWSRTDNWPISDVLNTLASATEHLLRDHNCDEQGPRDLEVRCGGST